jgi:hypothetical protein
MAKSSVPDADLVPNVDFIYIGSGMSAPWHKLSNFQWMELALVVDAFDPKSILYHHHIVPDLMAVQPRLAEFVRAVVDKQPAGKRVSIIGWPSREHCWQSLKANNAETFARFLRVPFVGDLAQWTPDWLHAVAIADNGGESAMERREERLGSLAVKALRCKLSLRATKRYKKAKAKGNIGLYAKLAANPKYAQAFGLAEGDLDYSREQLTPEIERNCWLAILRLAFIGNPDLRDLLVKETKNRLIVEHNKEAGQKAVLSGEKAAPHWGGLVKGAVVVGDNVMGRYLMEIRDELADDDEEEDEDEDTTMIIA